MTRLEKAFSIWSDIDRHYLRTNSKLTKAQFLKSLVGYGQEEKVYSALAKFATDISDTSGNSKFALVQSRMLATLNGYNLIPETVHSLNQTVDSFLGNTPTKMVTILNSFQDLVDWVEVYSPYRPKLVDFFESPKGVDYVDARSIHMIMPISDNHFYVKNSNDYKLLEQIPSNYEFFNRIKLQIADSKPLSPIIFINVDIKESLHQNSKGKILKTFHRKDKIKLEHIWIDVMYV